ncbi:APMAP [Mytilus edulis]|uniref:APMAP n=1 Tax=Mytilus edulis TaxID=6550 RepID=A0A8S3R465_MYTED|nr:APMAP [Mytilus edulis]
MEDVIDALRKDVTYIGCFEDPPIIELISPPYTRILEASYIEDQSMTIPGCLSICLDEGHTFAGLRHGKKCFCDSVITKHLTLLQLPNTECMTPCVGNATQHCGATYKLALYQLSTIFTGLADGRVVGFKGNDIWEITRFGKSLPECGSFQLEPICGRPKGMKIDKNGDLLVLDSYTGLYKVNVQTGEKELLVSSAKGVYIVLLYIITKW